MVTCFGHRASLVELLLTWRLTDLVARLVSGLFPCKRTQESLASARSFRAVLIRCSRQDRRASSGHFLVEKKLRSLFREPLPSLIVELRKFLHKVNSVGIKLPVRALVV